MTASTGQQPAQRRRAPIGRGFWRSLRSVGAVFAALLALLIVVAAIGAAAHESSLAADVLTLAIPAFLAGALSFLSPCSLPILIGYFSIALRQSTRDLGWMTVAFLAGLGTTMAVLGAGFTALGAAVIDRQDQLEVAGGLVVIAFGIMSLAGKGFSGIRSFERPAATVSGAYLYGLIFALGWTTCVGPILGAILTMLLAQGSSTGGALSLVAGGALAIVYVLGLGLPLLILVSALRSRGSSGRAGRMLKGRGWTVNVAGRAIHLHSTTMISGVMLIVLGVLLASGQMAELSRTLAGSPLSSLETNLERWLNATIGR